MEAIYDVNKGRRLKNYYYAAVTDGTCWGEALMRRFFQYNANFSIETRKRMVNENQYAIEATGTSEEGVALGYQLVDGSFFSKTFISYEMAKGEQVEEFRESESKRIANHESIIDELLK